MRIMKIVLIAFGGLIALLVIAGIAVVMLVDPNDYRAQIEQKAQQATGRAVHIGGKLDLKLFPWIALQVEGLSIGNAPGYGADPFLTVKRADVGVKLMPLLHKDLEVRRVTLEGLSVNLVTRSDEENNWKDFGGNEPQSSSGPGVEHASVAGLQIKDAQLLFLDESDKSRVRLSHLNVTVGAVGGDAPFAVHAATDYEDGTPDSARHIELKSTARMPPGGSSIDIKDLELKSRASTKDSPEITVSSPNLAVNWKAETLAPATLAIRFGSLPLTVTAQGEKIFTNRVITGTIDVPRTSPRDLMKSLGMEASKAGDPKALTVLSAKGAYRLTEKSVSLSALAAQLDDSHLRGKLGIDDFDTKALSFDLDIDRLNADRYREPEPKAAAPAKPAPPVDLPRDALHDLNMQGVLRIGELTVADLQLSAVRLPIEAINGLVKLTPQAKMYGGSYEGNIALDARPQVLHMTMNEHIRNVDVGSLANAAFESKRLAGRGDANILLSGAGKTDSALIKSLAGKFDLNVRDGAVNGVDLWYELRRAVALLKGTTQPARTEPVRTQFKKMSGTANLASGVIRNNDLLIDMDYLKAKGKGTLTVERQVIDYRVVAEVYKVPSSGEGAEMADIKAMEIPVSVTGTVADMKIRPDVGDLLKARVRKEVDKHKEDIKKKLDKKLQNLFNH